MQVLFESRDPGGARLRPLAVQRIRFVMRRLTWLVPRARIQLSDLNGPRGGLDKRCRLELRTDGSGTIVVTAVAADWRGALDAALARASRALLKRWQRARRPAPMNPRSGAAVPAA
jgi:hypothetical protein